MLRTYVVGLILALVALHPNFGNAQPRLSDLSVLNRVFMWLKCMCPNWNSQTSNEHYMDKSMNVYYLLKRAFEKGDVLCEIGYEVNLRSAQQQQLIVNNICSFKGDSTSIYNNKYFFLQVWPQRYDSLSISESRITGYKAYNTYDLKNILRTELTSYDVMAIAYKLHPYISRDTETERFPWNNIRLDIDIPKELSRTESMNAFKELIFTEQDFSYKLIQMREYLDFLADKFCNNPEYTNIDNSFNVVRRLSLFHHEQSILLEIRPEITSVLAFIDGLLKHTADYKLWLQQRWDNGNQLARANNFLITHSNFFTKINDRDGLSFASYCILPMQRVCKYPLLLGAIEKDSRISDARYRFAQKKIVDMVKDLNNWRRTSDIYSNIQDWKGINPNELGEMRSTTMGKIFVRDQKFVNGKLVITDHEIKERQICLYESVILFLRKDKNGGQIISGQIYLRTITSMSIISVTELLIKWISFDQLECQTTIYFLEPVAPQWYDMV